MKLRTLLILALVALAASCEVFVFFDGGSGLDSAANYYNAAPGEGYLYQVSSPAGSGDIWVVGQEFTEGLGLGEIDFVVTMAPSSDGTGLGAYTLAGVGDYQSAGASGTYVAYTAGLPVGDYADVYRIGHVFPRNFDDNATYSVDFTDRYGSVSYTIERVSDRLVQGNSYSNVIRVNATVANSGSSSINGSGAFYYAEGVGLIEATYTTGTSQTITFELKTQTTYGSKTRVLGQVVDPGGINSAYGLDIGVGWADLGMWDEIQNSGDAYSVQFYGTAVGFTLGYDTNGDSRTDTYTYNGDSYPRDYVLNGLSAGGSNVRDFTL